MVEAKNRSFYKQRPAKGRAPVIYRQPVSLETEVPPRLKSEDLLPAPNERAYHAEMNALKKRINRIKGKLAEKTEVRGDAALSLGELEEKKLQLQGKQTDLHKQRKSIEERLKFLNKAIDVDSKFLKGKKKMTSHQLIYRQKQIQNHITVHTLSPAKETELINELKQIEQHIPLLKKIEERDGLEMQYNRLWEEIGQVGQEIIKVESLIKAGHEKDKETSDNTPKEERKDVLVLKKQLNELEEQMHTKKAEFNNKMQEYIDQQSQILTGEWIAKQKAKLLKLRLKEAAEIKIEKEKCEKLIENCKKIAQQFSSIDAPEVVGVSQAKSAKEKKKKKKKKKKAETLIGALRLDTLRGQFEDFSILAPKKKEELGLAMAQLEAKLKEITNRPLTETIGKGNGGNVSDTLSVSSLSLSTEL